MVVADDHEALLERVAEILADHFTVVATVTDGAQLVDAHAAHNPDILVVDLAMPVMTGVEATTEIRRRGSCVPIVWITSSGIDVIDTARELGVLGYVRKTCLLLDLVPAMRAALEGREFVSQTPAGSTSER